MIRGTCPLCGRIYRVDDRFAGMAGKCKACGSTVTVPGEPVVGLDGLPAEPQAPSPSAGPPQREAPAPPPPHETPPRPPSPRPPEPSFPRVATQSVDVGSVPAPAEPAPSPAPQPEQPPPPEPEASPEAPRPAREDLESTHDARSRYEPDAGPTALDGSWLKEGAVEATAPAGPEPPSSGRAEDLLRTNRIVTTVEGAGPAGRPPIIIAACFALALLAAAFAVYCVLKAWPVGAVLAAFALGLGGLGFVRIWMGHWDGLIPGFLLCLCLLGTVVILSLAGASGGDSPPLSSAAIGFIAAGGATLLLLLLGLLLPRGREFFGA